MTPEHVPEEISVAARIAEHLVDLGTTTLFGVHGANAEDIFDAAWHTAEITPVIAKHEFAAGAMADGVARISGRPGAVLTTSGGGAFNVLPALAESYDSRVPVLALIGSAPRNTAGHGGFQDMLCPPDTVDVRAALAAVTGSCSVVEHPDTLDDALHAATAALRRGVPAAIVVPKDVQRSPARQPPRRPHTSTAPHDQPSTESTTSDSALSRLAARLVEASCTPGGVCIWAGEEASRPELGCAVDDLADLLAASVVVAPGGRDIAVTGCAGVTGVMGHPSAHRAVGAAQVCLIIGCRLSMTDRAGLDDALAAMTVIHLGADPPRTAGIDHLPCPDLTAATYTLLTMVRVRASQPPGRVHSALDHLDTGVVSSSRLTMRHVVDVIGSESPDGTAFFADAGNTGAAAVHHLPFPARRGTDRFVVALGMGGMGYAIAAGIGNAITDRITGRTRRTVVIAGDGSFLMHGLEVHTAIEHDAPLLMVILNNDAHGMCEIREDLYLGGRTGANRFRRTDIAAGLRAMFTGLAVWHAGSVDDVRAACRAAYATSGPSCIVVDTDPDEIPPFAPFLTKGPS